MKRVNVLRIFVRDKSEISYLRISLIFPLLFLFINAQAIPVNGFYGGVIIGQTYASEIELMAKIPFTRKSIKTQINLENGYNYGGQFGYRFYKYRLEGEVFSNENSFGELKFGKRAITPKSTFYHHSGKVNFLAAVGNIYYDLYRGNLIPYIGIGIGIAEIQSNLELFYKNYKIRDTKYTRTLPMAQAIIGINYFLYENFSMGFDFRYMRVPRQDIINASANIESINFLINFSIPKMI